MSPYNSLKEWGSVSKALHWALFVLVMAQVLMGIVIYFLDDEVQEDFDLLLAIWPYHEGIGLTVLPVAIAAFIWRLRNIRPEPVLMPRWQQILSRATHESIYVLIILLPLVGMVRTQAYGFPITYFGLFQFPKFMEKSESVLAITTQMHRGMGFLLTWLLVLHIAGALKHHFIDKDITLVRMLPGRS